MLTNSRLITPGISGNNHQPASNLSAKQPGSSVKIELQAKDQVSFSGSADKGKGKRQTIIEKVDNFLHPKSTADKLIEAAHTGDAQALKKLLNKTHQVYVKDWMGNTLLHHAAFSGDPETVFLLLCRHLNPYTQNRYGQTPIDFSANEEIKNIFRNDDCHESRRQGDPDQQEQREAETLNNRGIKPPIYRKEFEQNG